MIDLTPLRQFGEPFIIINYRLEGCQARIATPKGDVLLGVIFDTLATSVAALGGTPQQLGDLTIVRQGLSQGDFAPYCQNVLVLADRTRIEVYANGPASDLCAITEVGTATAVNKLARDGISYRPGRNSGVLIAGSDACALLDRAALTKVPGLDPNIRFPGFANWSCTWGASSKGSPHVSLLFRLGGVSADYADNYGDPTTIAGRRAWLHTFAGSNNPQRCDAYVVHRLAPSATAADEMFEIDVDAPGFREDLCARATELATAVDAKLPAS